MRADAEDRLREFLAQNPEAAREWAFSHKLRDDPRVTPMTRALRRWSLDELPQLFNVMKGGMSLIGPRPIVPGEVGRYGAAIIDYHACLPGITGLWQVIGRSALSFEQQAEMNSHYIRSWHPRMDGRIMLRTIPAVLRGDGAY